MYKLFVFAAILAFAFSAPAPEPKPQILVPGVPVVSPVYTGGLVVPASTYTATGVVAPVITSGVVVV